MRRRVGVQDRPVPIAAHAAGKGQDQRSNQVNERVSAVGPNRVRVRKAARSDLNEDIIEYKQ